MGHKCEHGTDTLKYICDKCDPMTDRSNTYNVRQFAPKLETLAEHNKKDIELWNAGAPTHHDWGT